MENRERRPRARVALDIRTLPNRRRSRPPDSLTPSRLPSRVVITSTYISRAHNYMMDVNTWDYAYERWDHAELEEMLFWFAASGQPIAHDSATEHWWDLIRRGRVRTIKASAPRERWTGIKQHVPLLRALDQHEAFGWFLHGRTRRAWEMLQEIKYVGPKIASWLLRDLSFLRDYAADTGDLSVKYSYPERSRDATWFHDLPLQEQAFFLPLDRWVIRRAQEYRIIPPSSPIGYFQGHWTRYLEAAAAIAAWARNNDLDPRDLDAYFYLTGIEELRADGICPVANGDSVWWCYESADRVDPERDWLSGEVVECARNEVTVRVKRQLRDLKTNRPIAQRNMSIASDKVRQDE